MRFVRGRTRERTCAGRWIAEGTEMRERKPFGYGEDLDPKELWRSFRRETDDLLARMFPADRLVSIPTREPEAVPQG